MVKDILKEIGLNKGETEIYLALLKTDQATVTQLTQETGIHRTYIYDILEKLKEKGLVSHTTEQHKQYYQCTPPKRLKEFLLEKVNKIENILPDLEKLQKEKTADVQIETFKGKEGIKTVLNDILREKKDYCILGMALPLEQILPRYTMHFLNQINKKKTKERAILAQGEIVTPAKYHDYRYVPKEYLMMTCVAIYADKIIIFVWDKPYIQILIKSKSIAKSYKSQFELLWNIGKKK